VAVWIGIIGTLCGALVGGGLALLNARLQFNQQVHRERQKLLLSKLEELHEVITKVQDSYEDFTLKTISNCLQIETPPKLKDAIGKAPIERVRLLVSIYAPELTGFVSELEQLISDYVEAWGYAITPTEFAAPLNQRVAAALNRQRGNDALVEVDLRQRRAAAEAAHPIDALEAQKRKIQAACSRFQAQLVILARRYL